MDTLAQAQRDGRRGACLTWPLIRILLVRQIGYRLRRQRRRMNLLTAQLMAPRLAA